MQDVDDLFKARYTDMFIADARKNSVRSSFR